MMHGVEYRGHTLDPFQEQAIAAIDRGHSVLLAAPTGAGKTLVAEYAARFARECGRIEEREHAHNGGAS